MTNTLKADYTITRRLIANSMEVYNMFDLVVYAVETGEILFSGKDFPSRSAASAKAFAAINSHGYESVDCASVSYAGFDNNCE